MARLLTHWFLVTVALATAVWILPGVQVATIPSLIFGGLVLGFVNAVIRPILLWATIPLTILTLGLFYLVVNAAAFALAAFLVPGWTVSGLGSAVLGAIIVSLVSSLLEWTFVQRETPRPRTV